MPPQTAKSSKTLYIGALWQGKEADSQGRIKSFMCIMDSMTEKELDSSNPKLMEAQSRIMRISRGSGRSPMEVHMLLGRILSYAYIIFWGPESGCRGSALGCGPVEVHMLLGTGFEAYRV